MTEESFFYKTRLTAVAFCTISVLCGSASASNSPDLIQQILNPKESELKIETAEDKGPLSIEEIINPPIFSASNTRENALTAPAWVIIITGEEMRERGYIELSQIFDDLPGIDVSRPFGATWFRPYWRGRRSGSWGDNFLFMIDNIPWHDHIYDNARMMIPISYIDRVEIVYGPGSLIHGSNAMMGSINVVTKGDSKQLGTQFAVVSGIHAPQSMIDQANKIRYLTDFSILHKSDDFRLSVTGRLEQGHVDEVIGDFSEYEYGSTRSEHYGDKDLWGPTLIEKYPNLSGEFRSPFRDMSLDIRLMTDEAEVGFQYFDFKRGTGSQFAADRYQNQSIWHDTFYGAHVRYTKTFDRLQSQFLARFRASVWPEDNTLLLLSGNPVTNTSPGTVKLNHYEASNHGIEINEFLKYQIPKVFGNDELTLIGGVNYAYNEVVQGWTSYTGIFQDTDAGTNNPEAGTLETESGQVGVDELPPANKLGLHRIAGYLMAKYTFLDDHHLDLGIRETFTRNNFYTSFRTAYVLSFWDRFTFKAMLGRAFKIPSQRQTYGFNTASLNQEDTEIRVETSTTYELSLNYNSDNINIQLSPYFVENKNIYSIDFANKSTDFYAAEILGVDLAAIASIPVPQMKQLKLWTYVTWYPLTRRAPYSSACNEKSRADYISNGVMGHNLTNRECWIGDIANLQIKGGITAKPINRLVVTALARYVNKRVTVSSNSIAKIDPYVTLDASVMVKNIGLHGLNMSLTVTNLTDARYFHPGIGAANSGDIQGLFEAGADKGSSGGSNSLLPQPGRAFQLLISTELD